MNVTAAQEVVRVTTNGSVSVVLYDPTKIPGRIVYVVNDTTQAGTTTVTTAAGNIAGGSSVSLVGAGAWAIFIADGTNYKLLNPSTGDVPTSRTLTAGAGMTGGGDLSADRTFNIVAADATITVNADSIQVGTVPVGQVSGAVASTRALTGSNAIKIAGDNSAHDLSADRTISFSGTDVDGSGIVNQLTGTAGSVSVPSGNLLTWASSGPKFGARPGTAADAYIQVAGNTDAITLFAGSNIIGFFTYNGGGPYFQQYNGAGFRMISKDGDLELVASTANTNVVLKPGNATKFTCLATTGYTRIGDNGTPLDAVDVAGRISMDLSSAPSSVIARGVLYLDSSGNLHFAGPAGSDTLIAGV